MLDVDLAVLYRRVRKCNAIDLRYGHLRAYQEPLLARSRGAGAVAGIGANEHGNWYTVRTL